MRGVKPNGKVWARVNAQIMGESVATVLVTFQSAMCQMLIDAGACATEHEARAHLAAMLLSPDDGAHPGSLVPQLHAELARLNDGKWIV
jgi:hypothetical protein